MLKRAKAMWLEVIVTTAKGNAASSPVNQYRADCFHFKIKKLSHSAHTLKKTERKNWIREINRGKGRAKRNIKKTLYKWIKITTTPFVSSPDLFSVFFVFSSTCLSLFWSLPVCLSAPSLYLFPFTTHLKLPQSTSTCPSKMIPWHKMRSKIVSFCGLKRHGK